MVCYSRLLSVSYPISSRFSHYSIPFIGQIKMGVVLSTDTMAIYTVMSLEGSTALVSVSGSNGGSLSKYGCRATVWYPTSTPMDLYPVISGPHEQLFPSKFGGKRSVNGG